MKTSHLSHVPKQVRRKALKTHVSHDTKLYHPLKSSFMPISVLYERFLRNLMSQQFSWKVAEVTPWLALGGKRQLCFSVWCFFGCFFLKHKIWRAIFIFSYHFFFHPAGILSISSTALLHGEISATHLAIPTN